MAEISRQSWDEFVLSHNGSFLQSRNWGVFQKNTGKKVLFLKENGWQSLVLINPLRFGKTYFYAPYGPVFDEQKSDKKTIFANFLNKIKPIAEEHNAIFLKIEPKTSDEKVAAIAQGFGFKKAGRSVQPQDSLIIDLKKPENEILESFEKRCRSEIKLADKKNVSFCRDNSENGIKNFLALLEKTAARDSFKTHSSVYYRIMVENLAPAGQIDLFFAKIGTEIISGCITVYFGKTASYIHAASSGAYRAANALVWHAIKEAKRRECDNFDLYGVSPAEAGESHPWHGLTKFKESFGGERTHYIGAFDYVFSNIWYSFYKLGKKSFK